MRLSLKLLPASRDRPALPPPCCAAGVESFKPRLDDRASDPGPVDLKGAVASSGEDPAATIQRLEREVEDLKRQLQAALTWHTPPDDMPVVTTTGYRLGWRGPIEGWKVTEYLETHEVYAIPHGRTQDDRPAFKMVEGGGWLTPLEQPSSSSSAGRRP